MKKMAVALATTTIAALGTLAVAPAAQADPYPRSVDTQCVAVTASTKVAPGETVRVKFKWTAEGNANPKGTVNFVAKRKNGVVVKRGSFFSPAKATTKTVALSFPKGNYTVQFRTATGPNSVFQNCSASTDTIRVRPGA